MLQTGGKCTAKSNKHLLGLVNQRQLVTGGEIMMCAIAQDCIIAASCLCSILRAYRAFFILLSLAP